jgi:hypothetical protein
MMPKHLEGKSAVEIMNELKKKWSGYEDERYIEILEVLLFNAVEHALLNADEVKELISEGQYNAMPRAITFLNMVLPME